MHLKVFCDMQRGCMLQEIDDLCEEWQPEPLHMALPNSQALPEPPIISRRALLVIGFLTSLHSVNAIERVH